MRNSLEIFQRFDFAKQVIFYKYTCIPDKMIMAESALFDQYKESLAEGLEGETRSSFMEMADMVRDGMLTETTAYGFSPIAPLTMPIFRRLWPMLVVREACTVIPMDKPEITKSFLRIVANVNGTEYEVPSNTQAVSTAQHIGTTTTTDTIDMPSLSIAFSNKQLEIDLLKQVDATYTPQIAHVQSADFIICGATIPGKKTSSNQSPADESVEIYIEPEDNGTFSFEVPCYDLATSTTNTTDVISGKIDYYTGKLVATSLRGIVKNITVSGTVSTFEEMVANSVTLKNTYIKLRAEDQELQANWSIQFEQDYKAYFDLDVQTQLVENMGKLIAMDIDRKLLRKIINETEKFNPTSCGSGVSGDRFTFDRRPSSNFAFGQHMGRLAA